jgi:hypothetical protein
MAQYTTRLGDTPGKISLLLTGSPLHVADLVAANPQKPRKGGTFATLLPGETLKVPDNWFKGLSGYGAYGPKYGGSGGQFPREPRDQSLYPVTGGSSVYGQYYVISQGQLTLGALIAVAHPDQTIPPGFQSAAIKNANPLLAGVDPNVNLPKGTRVNVPSRWVNALKKGGYTVGNNVGVGCPKADAMLKQVDPYGIAMGVGAMPGEHRPAWVRALEIVGVAVAVGAAVTVLATRVGATENPVGPSYGDPPSGEKIAEQRGKYGYVFVTKEADGQYYVWYEDRRSGKPSWTYSFKSKAKAIASMKRGTGPVS